MVKKAIIEVSLVEESKGMANSEIKDEIVLELSGTLHAIPWAEKIEKVTVTSK